MCKTWYGSMLPCHGPSLTIAVYGVSSLLVPLGGVEVELVDPLDLSGNGKGSAMAEPFFVFAT
jgi:hypothetical protein